MTNKSVINTPALIDTHIHFDDERFDGDRQKIYQNAIAHGVRGLVIPATTHSGWQKIQALAVDYPHVYATVGLHPMFCNQHSMQQLDSLPAQLVNCVAIGECGLDKQATTTDFTEQQDYFSAQIELAKQFNMPLIIHARGAIEEVILMLKSASLSRAQANGVIHSFNGSLQQAKRLIDLNFKLSFGGAVTYQRAHKLHRLVSTLPLKSLMLETDAPDQPCSAQRGQRNEPRWLQSVLHEVAKLRPESAEQIADTCNQNAIALFSLPASLRGRVQ